MIYFANPSTPTIRAAMTAGRLGCIITPKQGNLIPDGATYIADNGCFGKGYPGDTAWYQWLTTRNPTNCVFATAPDALCDHQRTYLRADPWLDRIRDLGHRAAFVAQNGCRPNKLAWDRFDVLFIGGDDPFKLGPIARDLATQAKDHGKWVHMGRVNSHRRIRYAKDIGCHSADGTHLAFGPDINLPIVEGWLTKMRTNPTLFDED